MINICNDEFEKISMYKCKWCGKIFRSTRHKCMFNPSMKNCFSCKYCKGFDSFEGQRADPESGWSWELEPYRMFACELEKTINTDYADFDSLHDRKWIGNCPYYEIRDSYNGKQSYAKIFDVTEEKADLELKEFQF